MNRFLTKFAGTIQNRQTQQILKILNKRRQQGDFTSLAEFQEGFQELMSELVQENLVPSLTHYPASAFDEVSVEIHNEMLTRASNDLIASFEELDKIREVQVRHEGIVHEILLRNLRSGLSELQARVQLYEFLNKDANGFELAKYSTFKETQEERTNRGTNISSSLFTDPKTQKFFLSKYDAAVDLVGERLTLGVGNKKEIKIEEIEQTFGPTFPQNAFDIINEDIDDISNIIDQAAGTFWIRSVYQDHQNGIGIQLKLNLAGIREFNYIEFETALIRPITLKKISWQDHSLLTQALDNLNEEIKGITKITFSKISTGIVYLDFFIPDCLQFQDENPDYSNLSVLSEIVPPAVAESIIASGVTEIDPQKGFKYQIGFDNIRLGLSTYTNKGVYVSQPLTIEPEDSGDEEASKVSAIIGLKAISKRPYESTTGILFTEDVETDKAFLGSVEYWLLKKDLQADGSIVKMTTFPILPMGTKEVKHERLVFSKDDGSENNFNLKNSGRLSFYPDTAEPITLYVNGLQISLSDPQDLTPWNQAHLDTVNTVVAPNSGVGKPMVYYLRVNKSDIKLGDIFTVSYTPKTSDSHSSQYVNGVNNPIDLAGNMSIVNASEQMILLEESSDINIQKYELYLIIILRQNTAEVGLSPAVEEYTLAVGKKDLLRFEE